LFCGKLNACEAINVSQDGDLSTMQATLTNVGDQKSTGVDWNMQYAILLSHVEYTGTIDGNNGAYSKIQST
jgi:iron complex outermembrane receptor protein